MKKLFLAFVAIVSIGLAGAFANYTMTQGAGTTFGSVVVGGFHYVQMFVCDLTTPAQCQSVSAGGAAKVDGSAVTQPVAGTGTAGTPAGNVLTVQGVTSMTKLLVTPDSVALPANQSTNEAQINGVTPLMGNGVTGTGSQRVTIASDNTAFSVNATQTTSSNLKAQVDPLTAASWGIGTSAQNSTIATNGQLALAQFNTVPTTITSTNMSPLQLDNAGNLLVNIKAGAGSGGTALADNSAFTQSTTSETPAGCLYNTGYANATSGRSTVVRCTIDGSVYSNNQYWAGTVLGAPSNYGTSPGAVAVPGVNAFVTNTNANGQATAANSSPVVLPAAQVTVDPCSLGTKTNIPISQNGTSSVQLIALSGSTVIYVCSLSLIAAGATTAVITTGTGTACVTSNAAVIGDTTANIANGLSFAANGGLTLGNGAGTIAKGAASSELCMTLGTNVRMSGNLTYVQQ